MFVEICNTKKKWIFNQSKYRIKELVDDTVSFSQGMQDDHTAISKKARTRAIRSRI